MAGAMSEEGKSLQEMTTFLRDAVKEIGIKRILCLLFVCSFFIVDLTENYFYTFLYFKPSYDFFTKNM